MIHSKHIGRPAKKGMYTVSFPYAGNVQYNITMDDGTSVVLVVEYAKDQFTEYILNALGFELDEDAMEHFNN